MKRRDFAKTLSLAALAPASLNLLASPGGEILTAERDPKHLVYDRRLVHPGFEMQATLGFEQVHSIEGDVTQVWYEHLHHLWREGRITTVGLTRGAEFFVLKTLARDYRYQVSSETTEGEVVSWVLSPTTA